VITCAKFLLVEMTKRENGDGAMGSHQNVIFTVRRDRRKVG
jgi:hypothetical protein